VADSKGRAVISAAGDSLHRYRFGFQTADFLICRHCGVYIGAVIGVDRANYATLNAAGLNFAEFAGRDVTPVNFDEERVPDRLARRRALWTPVEVIQARVETAIGSKR